MAGWTDLAFRLTAKSYGVGLVYTEMVSAAGLVRREAKSWRLIRSHPTERPLVVQLFGGRADILAEAAALIEAAGAEAVDLNFGCPVKKVIRQGAGAVLLKDRNRLRDIIRRVRRTVKIPVLAKIRSGWSRESGPMAVEAARMAEGEGLDGLVVHPRFARQGFTGRADWSVLRDVARAVKMPVIGSGDVREPVQAAAMLDQTGCAGVMIGRAAVGRPWIFEQTLDVLRGVEPRRVDMAERWAVMLRHILLMAQYEGPQKTWLRFKGLAGRYVKGFAAARQVRQAVHESGGLEELIRALEGFGGRIFDQEMAA